MVLKVYVQDQVMVSVVVSSRHYESMLENQVSSVRWSRVRKREREQERDR